MKVLIFGSQQKYLPPGFYISAQVNLISAAIHKFQIYPDEIVTGGDAGIGSAAIMYGVLSNIPIKRFHPDWDKNGRGAGKARDKIMSMYAEVGVGFQWNRSPDAGHVISIMRALRKPYYTVFNGDLDYAF